MTEITHEEIAKLFKCGQFYPNLGFVIELSKNIDKIFGGETKDSFFGFDNKLALSYISEYMNNYRYLLMLYTHLSYDCIDEKIFIPNNKKSFFGNDNDLFPLFNLGELNNYFYTEHGVTYGTFIELESDQVMLRIVGNIQFLYFTQISFYNALSAELSNNSGLLKSDDIEKIANSFYESFLFINGIVKHYNIKLSQFDNIITDSYKMEDDDYFYILFFTKDLYYRLGNKEKIGSIEKMIENHFDINPYSFWKLHYYKFKYIYSLDNKYITKLADTSSIMIDKKIYGIDLDECNLYIKLLKILESNNLHELEGIVLNYEKKGVNYYDNNSNSVDNLLVKSEVINNYTILNFLYILQIGLNIKNNFKDRELIEKGIKDIYKLVENYVYKLKYDFNSALAFRFDLYKDLLNINNIDNEVLTEKLDIINYIIKNDYISDNERKIYNVIIEIIESKIKGLTYIPEDLYVKFMNDLTSLSLDSHILLGIIYHLRKQEVSKLSDVDEINNYIYNCLRIMEEDVTKYNKLNEEDIRSEIVSMIKLLSTVTNKDIYISAETKNANGKTDIMINVNGNKYIFECLIWGGNTKYYEKYKQLLGYLTPKEKSGGLISFVTKHKNYTNVIKGLEDLLDEKYNNIIKEKNFYYKSETKTNKHDSLDLRHHINYLGS